MNLGLVLFTGQVPGQELQHQPALPTTQEHNPSRLARPSWPRSAPTIPSTFYKVNLDKVGVYVSIKIP